MNIFRVDCFLGAKMKPTCWLVLPTKKISVLQFPKRIRCNDHRLQNRQFTLAMVCFFFPKHSQQCSCACNCTNCRCGVYEPCKSSTCTMVSLKLLFFSKNFSKYPWNIPQTQITNNLWRNSFQIWGCLRVCSRGVLGCINNSPAPQCKIAEYLATKSQVNSRNGCFQK